LVSLSDREREILEAVVEGCRESPRSVLRYAARKLRTTPGYIANVLYRIRRRYDEALDFIEEVRRYRKRLPYRRRFL